MESGIPFAAVVPGAFNALHPLPSFLPSWCRNHRGGAFCSAAVGFCYSLSIAFKSRPALTSGSLPFRAFSSWPCPWLWYYNTICVRIYQDGIMHKYVRIFLYSLYVDTYRQLWYTSLCWEDRPHFLRLPIHGDLPSPSTPRTIPAPARTLDHHPPAHGPGLERVQFLPAPWAAKPPAPVDLFYRAFALLGHQTDTSRFFFATFHANLPPIFV